MKRITILLAMLLAGVHALAQSADVPEITYIGRTLKAGGTVQADWIGTMAVVRFQGRTLELDYANSGITWLNIWVDREPGVEADAVVNLEAEGTLELARFKKAGENTVYVQKRTEGENGLLTFKAFRTDGHLLQARPWKDRVIEIIGDSYTCGYGVEAPDRDSPAIPEEENCNKSYSGILGRYFGADVVRISHSGRGIVRNYGDGDPEQTMPVRYLRTFDEKESPVWKADYRPDIVVIYLGTNDFSIGKQPSLESWCAGYKTLLEEIRFNYGPEVPILCVASNANVLLGDYVKEAALHSGVPNVYWTAIMTGAHNVHSDLGAAWHPNYQGMRKVASLIAPYIATLTGWDLPEDLLK